jgi:hypothetical protein
MPQPWLLPLWIGGWVGLRAGLDTKAKEKILFHCWGSTLVIQSVVRHYTDWATPAPNAIDREILHWGKQCIILCGAMADSTINKHKMHKSFDWETYTWNFTVFYPHWTFSMTSLCRQNTSLLPSVYLGPMQLPSFTFRLYFIRFSHAYYIYHKNMLLIF